RPQKQRLIRHLAVPPHPAADRRMNPEIEVAVQRAPHQQGAEHQQQPGQHQMIPDARPPIPGSARAGGGFSHRLAPFPGAPYGEEGGWRGSPRWNRSRIPNFVFLTESFNDPHTGSYSLVRRTQTTPSSPAYTRAQPGLSSRKSASGASASPSRLVVSTTTPTSRRSSSSRPRSVTRTISR